MQIEKDKKIVQSIIEVAKAKKDKKGTLVGIILEEEVQAIENLFNEIEELENKIQEQKTEISILKTIHGQECGHLVQEKNELKKENENLKCLIRLTNKSKLKSVLKVLEETVEE